MVSQDASPISKFRSPPRILIPKLADSRDGWKRKATQHKAELKAAAIRIRDLSTSRELWKKRAREAEQKVEALTEQLQQSQDQLQQAQDALTPLSAEQKKTTHPHRN
jgi:chromosome segregation ATPase